MTTKEQEEKGLSYIPQITAAYDAVLKAEQNSLNEKIKLGELLIKAKEAVGHGGFAEWLEKHFPKKISHRTANVYMQLAERKDKLDEVAKSQHAAILAAGGEMSVRQALIGIRTPEEIAKAEERADKAKATKKENEAAKAAESAGKSGSISLDDLIPVSDPDEVLKVLTDRWEEEKLTKLSIGLMEYLKKRGKGPASDVRRPLLQLPPTM